MIRSLIFFFSRLLLGLFFLGIGYIMALFVVAYFSFVPDFLGIDRHAWLFLHIIIPLGFYVGFFAKEVLGR